MWKEGVELEQIAIELIKKVRNNFWPFLFAISISAQKLTPTKQVIKS
jgi:hypothetical protein